MSHTRPNKKLNQNKLQLFNSFEASTSVIEFRFPILPTGHWRKCVQVGHVHVHRAQEQGGGKEELGRYLRLHQRDSRSE